MPGDTLNATLPAEAPYDEMFGADGECRPQYQPLYKRLDEIPREELNRRQLAADLSFLHQGITFTVYGRDYSDVPPTRGVFKGAAESELSVAVQVKPAEEPDSEEALRLIAVLNRPPEAEHSAQQQQQQQ